MNNQVKLIDAYKLLKWLSGRMGSTGCDSKYFAYETVQEAIESGEFTPDTPVPTIKPGDKATHIERGKGTVLWVLSDHASVQFNDVIKICKIRDLEVVE